MWTTRMRERAVGAFPPDQLLPDRQPSYVASWIYVFGVLSIAALVVVVVSGGILGLKGPAWWHVSSVGRFFNGLHLWGVELLFFFMVIHLWGKFFMAAWRGGRSRDLGHGGDRLPGLDRSRVHRLSLAAELRLPMDRHPGQGRPELGRHRRVLQRLGLRPDVHATTSSCCRSRWSRWWRGTSCSCAARRRAAVRRRAARGAQGAPPTRRQGGTSGREPALDDDRYTGVEGRLRALRPRQGDRHRARRRRAAGDRPDGPVLVSRRQAEHDRARGPGRTRATSSRPRPASWRAPATPPATGRPTTTRPTQARSSARSSSSSGPASTSPIDTARDFVLAPLHSIPANPALQQALTSYQAALAETADGLDRSLHQGDRQGQDPAARPVALPPGNYGPVAPMMASLLGLAQTGGLDGAASDQQAVLPDRLHQAAAVHGRRRASSSDRAEAQHLLGDQWGMMNETGSYPGQVWLWLYTFWYQIKPFQDNRQRRRADLGHHGRPLAGLHLHPVHPRRQIDPALDPHPQADLARALPPLDRALNTGARRQRARCCAARKARDLHPPPATCSASAYSRSPAALRASAYSL